MYTAACPSCGAPVTFRSAASVVAVCEYCQSTLLRDAEQIKDIGKMSSTLEDYSRLQIGSSGQYQGRGFNVVGRIQLRYEAGFWNEWYLFFDDGEAAWLGEASGQYMLTRSLGAAPDAPEFSSIQPEMAYLYEQRSYVFADVRSAQCAVRSAWPVRASCRLPLARAMWPRWWMPGTAHVLLPWITLTGLPSCL